MTLTIEKQTVTAKPRKLKASWTLEYARESLTIGAKMKNTHEHQILEYSPYAYLGIVKRRNQNRKWFELKMLGAYQWDKEGSATISTLKRLYGPGNTGYAWKFKTQKEAKQAFTWVMLNRS